MRYRIHRRSYLRQTWADSALAVCSVPAMIFAVLLCCRANHQLLLYGTIGAVLFMFCAVSVLLLRYAHYVRHDYVSVTDDSVVYHHCQIGGYESYTATSVRNCDCKQGHLIIFGDIQRTEQCKQSLVHRAVDTTGPSFSMAIPLYFERQDEIVEKVTAMLHN